MSSSGEKQKSHIYATYSMAPHAERGQNLFVK